FALTRACLLAADTDVTIYTDSRYAFGVAHDFGRIWSTRGFVAADGKPISHASLVQDLIEACHKPHALSIIKTKAHSRELTDEARGNSLADLCAKTAAQSGVFPPFLNTSVSSSPLQSALLPGVDLHSVQHSAAPSDLALWDASGATTTSTGLVTLPDGRLCLPAHCLPFLVREFHGPTHRGRRGVKEMLAQHFCIDKMSSRVDIILDSCLTCAQNNPSKPTAQHQHLPTPDTPFQEWQIDFTHLPKKGPFRYLLVMVDKFSRWIEAFPCANENAKTVVRILCKEIIPRYGVPVGIDSDKGTPFTSKVTQLLCSELHINCRFHIPYHPQSSGIVERANRTIKNKLRKAMQTMASKNWPDILPIVLADMRMMSQPGLNNLSPYEIVMGRPFPAPWHRGNQALGTGDLSVHLSEYSAGLIAKLNEYWERTNQARPPISENHTHPFEVGSKVLVKLFKRAGEGNEFNQPLYSEPAEVVALTRTAVLTDLFPQWIHATRLKAAPLP
ncbi:MAG: DDE-type integrase/transposase/recombinase, partial [Brevinema sp.]